VEVNCPAACPPRTTGLRRILSQFTRHLLTRLWYLANLQMMIENNVCVLSNLLNGFQWQGEKIDLNLDETLEDTQTLLRKWLQYTQHGKSKSIMFVLQFRSGDFSIAGRSLKVCVVLHKVIKPRKRC